MRQSGVLAKYSACETAEVRLVRFSTFTKEELVAVILSRSRGQSQKSLKPDSTKAWNPLEEVFFDTFRT